MGYYFGGQFLACLNLIVMFFLFAQTIKTLCNKGRGANRKINKLKCEGAL
jgi:hypothetical protein